MDLEKLEATLKELLKKNQPLVYRNYHNKNDQILIDGELVAKMKESIQKEFPQAKEQKYILKKLLRKILGLDSEDLLIFTGGHIFIKLASKLAQIVPTDKKDANEVRYNGFDEKELSAFYTDFFDEEDVRNLIKQVAKKFINKYFIQKSISNEEYEKKVFFYIKELFYDSLQQRFENKDEFLRGLSGYIFRTHFEEIFIYVARSMLEMVAAGNAKIILFLEYYSHDIIIQNGEKYKVPPIKSPSGHRWKITTMAPVIRIHFSTLRGIAKLKEKIENLEKESVKYHIDGDTTTSLIEKQKKLKLKIRHLDEKLSDKLDTIEKVHHAILIEELSPRQKQELRSEISRIKGEADEIKNEKKLLEKMLLSSSELAKYQKIQRELAELKRELRNKTYLLEQNNKKYKEFKSALVRTLIQKKKKIRS